MQNDNLPGRLHKMTEVFYPVVPSTADARSFTDSLVTLLFPIMVTTDINLKEQEMSW